ncbi:hypothetical protein BWR19_07880 [Halomonas sp. 1513]|nr:TadE/TadG family type IV pilus assembly protein [Halomonas sp. 1513]APX92855.1 hypothetical protein BWR19_07880 [Halomonas sp. 1513]
MHKLRFTSRVGAGRSERGAVAIEFAVLFPLFFVILYAIISYSLLFAMSLTLNALSSEAARAAIAVNTRVGEPPDAQRVEARIQGLVGDSWLSRVEACDDGDFHRIDAASDELRVCLEAPLPLPQLNLGVLRIPDIEWVRARASLLL